MGAVKAYYHDEIMAREETGWDGNYPDEKEDSSFVRWLNWIDETFYNQDLEIPF